MKPGDLVKFKCSPGSREIVIQYGMFLGYRTFDKKYTCAEVMWYPENIIKTIQSDLLEVINERR